MSKTSTAGVVVTLLFNIAILVTPSISEEHKRIAFYYTLPLLFVACIWWVWAYFKTSKPKAVKTEVPPQTITARDVTGSYIATAARDVIYHAPTNPPASPDESNPRLETLDELRELLREGDSMLRDFYLGNWEGHTPKSVAEYDNRVRKCAKRRVLNVSDQAWGRFGEPWDLDEILLKASELADAKLLPDFLLNNEPSTTFGNLYGRVERLRELLTALTGFKIESPYPLGGPAAYQAKRIAPEIGPRVVPPRQQMPESAENPQIENLKQKLENLLAKAKRLEVTPESPGFDIPGAIRRNQRFITEVREEIARLQGEQPKRTISFDQESDMLRILKAVEMRPIWLTSRMNAHKDDEEAHAYTMQVLRVLSQAGVTVSQCAIDLGTLFPDGVNLYCNDNLYNQPTAAAIIDAIRVTGVRCNRIDRQVWSQHGIAPEINLMIGSNIISKR